MIEREESVDSMQIEINSLKFSQNKDFFTCITGILIGLLDSCSTKLSLHFEKWHQILSRYVSSDAERNYAIKELESLICQRPEQNQFHLIIKVLYANDIIDGECILAWNKNSICEPLKELVIPR